MLKCVLILTFSTLAISLVYAFFRDFFCAFLLINELCFYSQVGPLIYQTTYLVICKNLNLQVSLTAGVWDLNLNENCTP